MLRKALYLLSRVVSKPVTHSSALTLGRSEAERTYSSHKKPKTLFHALQLASSHPSRHRKRNVLTYHPPQAPIPLPKPLLLSAATRTATNARGRGGEAGRPQGVKPAKTEQRLEAARCGVGNVPPCDNIERGETKSSGPEGTTYTHTMVSERRERGLPPGNLLCRCSSQSRRMATSFAAGEPCITRRGQ